jgi:ubiquitin carboxyl-terminal hydrolase 4/11/15
LEEFSDDAASCVYDLVSVCNHFGQLGAGHYVSTVCLDVTDAAPGQEWVELDDALCVPIADKASVVSEAAYILFYRRRAEAG